MYALSAYIAPLKIRCATVGPRRRQNALTTTGQGRPEGAEQNDGGEGGRVPG